MDKTTKRTEESSDDESAVRRWETAEAPQRWASGSDAYLENIEVQRVMREGQEEEWERERGLEIVLERKRNVVIYHTDFSDEDPNRHLKPKYAIIKLNEEGMYEGDAIKLRHPTDIYRDEGVMCFFLQCEMRGILKNQEEVTSAPAGSIAIGLVAMEQNLIYDQEGAITSKSGQERGKSADVISPQGSTSSILSFIQSHQVGSTESHPPPASITDIAQKLDEWFAEIGVSLEITPPGVMYPSSVCGEQMGTIPPEEFASTSTQPAVRRNIFDGSPIGQAGTMETQQATGSQIIPILPNSGPSFVTSGLSMRTAKTFIPPMESETRIRVTATYHPPMESPTSSNTAIKVPKKRQPTCSEESGSEEESGSGPDDEIATKRTRFDCEREIVTSVVRSVIKEGENGGNDEPVEASNLTVSTQVLIKCGLCDEVFAYKGKRKQNLIYHALWHCPWKEYQCCFCSYRQCDYRKICLHLETKHVGRMGDPIKYRHKLMSAIHDVYWMRCFPLLDIGFQQLGRALKHTDMRIPPMQCQICKENIWGEVAPHHIIDYHEGLEVYYCDRCPYQTAFNLSMSIHYQAEHQSDLPHHIYAIPIDLYRDTSQVMKSVFPQHMDGAGANYSHQRLMDAMQPEFSKVALYPLMARDDGLDDPRFQGVLGSEQCQICKHIFEGYKYYDYFVHAKTHLNSDGHQWACPERWILNDRKNCVFTATTKFDVEVHMWRVHGANCEGAAINRTSQVKRKLLDNFKSCFPRVAQGL